MKLKSLNRAIYTICVLIALIIFSYVILKSSDTLSPHAGLSPPNVILLSIDTLRPDHLSGYGYERNTSPFLDSIATEGVKFVNTFAQASWTLPSHMSLLTSSYPMTHGVENDNTSLPDFIPTLAEVLQNAGYKTYAFVSWIYLKSEFGFGRGFDEFHELLASKSFWNDSSTHHSIKAEAFVKQVSQWAHGKTAKPYFLFLHLFDPHMSYEPPLEYALMFDSKLKNSDTGSYNYLKRSIKGLRLESSRISKPELTKATALYDGEIRYVDTELKKLFEVFSDLGMLENTMIVFTSDHGEEFDDHGSMEGHGWTLYDEVLRIPLSIRFPNQKYRGKVIKQIVQSIDIAPFILDVVGVNSPSTFEGRSLFPLIAYDSNKNKIDWKEFAFSHIRRFNMKRALRTPEYKLILTGGPKENSFGVPIQHGYEMYNLEKDYGEQVNIYKSDSPTAQKMMARLKAFSSGKRPKPKKGPELTREERRRLQSLGYLK